ncbi:MULTISPECIES: AI-2E family transporter [unclassified Clostridium]|uniref:AI-2E family transporter n=1 Tax=unclassified Clostridium TaxID=2614128 RepID=UPI0025BE1F0F|nr:AI-2E family transporter [Clostridium sp.]MCI6691335.1 AI-2E family transporter [Clostridium sp.]MDY2631767.1 AI-2E family transporter [Clostridium sp.]MDY4253146.1 AI-2E family transporter [Clostridium sp.]
MKEINKKLKENILLGTYLIILYFLLLNIKWVTAALGSILGIISPFITAFAMAFVLNLPMKFFENKVFNFLDKEKSSFLRNLKRPLSILTTFISVIGFIVALILFVVPQLAASLSTLLDAVPGYMESFEKLLNQYLSSTEILQHIYNTLMNTWQELLKYFANFLSTSLTGILNTTVSITSGLINFILSLVLTIYMLASKETLIYQIKKILYAFLNNAIVDKILSVSRLTNNTFAKFITGQCIEAIILGVLCFIGMTIFKMPYSLLISVLIGVTALIPVFGAFIGTIPAVFLILIINPIQAIWFVVFILCLQQFEGNIIYPRVVGNSVGLSAIWVMLAMLVGGSTLGLIGMLIGIPLFSVAYQLIKDYTNKRLNKKDLKI